MPPIAVEGDLKDIRPVIRAIVLLLPEHVTWGRLSRVAHARSTSSWFPVENPTLVKKIKDLALLIPERNT